MLGFFTTHSSTHKRRVTQKSKTSISNILFNNFEFTIISGNIAHSISDYATKSNAYKQNFKSFNRNKLNKDFCKIDQSKVIHENDNNTNGTFNSFFKTCTNFLDHHAPLTKITKEDRTLHLKPWTNKEIKYLK